MDWLTQDLIDGSGLGAFDEVTAISLDRRYVRSPQNGRLQRGRDVRQRCTQGAPRVRNGVGQTTTCPAGSFCEIDGHTPLALLYLSGAKD